MDTSISLMTMKATYRRVKVHRYGIQRNRISYLFIVLLAPALSCDLLRVIIYDASQPLRHEQIWRHDEDLENDYRGRHYSQ
jgi:hypothetical protein